MNTETHGFGNTAPSLQLTPTLLDIAATLRDSPRTGLLPGPLRSCQHSKGILKLIGNFIVMMTLFVGKNEIFLFSNESWVLHLF